MWVSLPSPIKILNICYSAEISLNPRWLRHFFPEPHWWKHLKRQSTSWLGWFCARDSNFNSEVEPFSVFRSMNSRRKENYDTDARKLSLRLLLIYAEWLGFRAYSGQVCVHRRNWGHHQLTLTWVATRMDISISWIHRRPLLRYWTNLRRI